MQYTFCILLLIMSISSQANSLAVKVLLPDKTAGSELVVYLTPITKKPETETKKAPLIIKQKDKKFIPYITVTQKNKRLNFENNDDITHHIYSVSGGNRFDFKIKSENKSPNVMLSRLGEVAMGCNIHDWMSGYILVVDTHLYTQTDSEGIAYFDNLVADNYKVTIWHPQLLAQKNQFQQEVQIAANRTLTIQLPVGLSSIPQQEDQDELEFLEGY